MWMYITAFIAAIVFLLFSYLQNWYKYWEIRGVPTLNFKYIVGNLGPSLTLTKSLAECYEEIYNEFKGSRYRYLGYYKFLKPGLIIRDPDLIKDILVKDFSSFERNDIYVDEKNDLIFGKNPFTLYGPKWKEVRNIITPSFSSAKVRATISLLEENRQKLIKYLREEPNASNKEGLEAKNLASKFTCDNVASVAFGLNGKSFEDPKADFIEIGRKLTNPTFALGMKQLAVFIMPTLSNILKIKFFSDEATDFLRNIVLSTLQYRKENNIVRNDFLDNFNDLKKKLHPDFTDDDILAHAGGFFADGFETSSIAICFALYELAGNENIQETLRKEVHGILKKHHGIMSYEAIQEMTYLDCVFKESLRMHVPLLAMTKVCTASYQLPPLLNDNTGPHPVLEVGTPIIIPVHGLHHDEKYFPDPECFNPQRFSEENKDSINKFTYLPFGEGPRACLGVRYGVLQSKIAIATIISEFNLTVNSKTIEPIKIDPRFFMKAATGGLWLNFHTINK